MTRRAASPASCHVCTSTGASLWNIVPAPYGIPPARMLSSPRSGPPGVRARAGQQGDLGALSQDGPEQGLWAGMGPGLRCSTTPSPSPRPQVYEGLKPSDKYEKPLDYRYGLGTGDLLRAHMDPCPPTHCLWTPWHYPSVAPTPG